MLFRIVSFAIHIICITDKAFHYIPFEHLYIRRRNKRNKLIAYFAYRLCFTFRCVSRCLQCDTTDCRVIFNYGCAHISVLVSLIIHTKNEITRIEWANIIHTRSIHNNIWAQHSMPRFFCMFCICFSTFFLARNGMQYGVWHIYNTLLF